LPEYEQAIKSVSVLTDLGIKEQCQNLTISTWPPEQSLTNKTKIHDLSKYISIRTNVT
jgi:hypothetical protein